MDEKELIGIDNSIFLEVFPVQGRNHFVPMAMKRKENVQCTFLANRRAGGLGNYWLSSLSGTGS